MKTTDKIDQAGEDALNEIAHELDQIAEEIRGRGMRGRQVGDVAGSVCALREQMQRLDLLTNCD